MQEEGLCAGDAVRVSGAGEGRNPERCDPWRADVSTAPPSCLHLQVRGLASFGLELDFTVEEYAGSKGRFPPAKRRRQRALYVATIEKSHSLVNALTEAGRLEELGLLVVDEVRDGSRVFIIRPTPVQRSVLFQQLHMLGDSSRGAILEMTLAKVSNLSSECVSPPSVDELLDRDKKKKKENPAERADLHQAAYFHPILSSPFM